MPGSVSDGFGGGSQDTCPKQGAKGCSPIPFHLGLKGALSLPRAPILNALSKKSIPVGLERLLKETCPGWAGETLEQPRQSSRIRSEESLRSRPKSQPCPSREVTRALLLRQRGSHCIPPFRSPSFGSACLGPAADLGPSFGVFRSTPPFG